MVTIVLLVSRVDYLQQVVSRIELLECDRNETNILCIVDGDDALYVRTRNLINGTKFRDRLTKRLDYPGERSRFDIQTRRERISAAHNQARDLIQHTYGHVFSVEDDTLVGHEALKKLLRTATLSRACAFVEGVELGRWDTPYVGAWIADDVYQPTRLTSVENKQPVLPDEPPTKIDAGGLYCALMRADLYKQHNFRCDNGLGPDINFGLEARQLGYDNYIDWDVPCVHLYSKMGVEYKLTPKDESKITTLSKINNKKWHTSS